jgi:5'-nucleotidase
MAVRLVENWDALQLPPRTLLNINVPEGPLEAIKGFRVSRLGHRGRAQDVMTLEDPRGREVFWIGLAGAPADAGEGTDFHAVQEGWVSVTPLQTDLTRHEALPDVARWLKDL